MRIYDGSPRQDWEEVLRSIGAFIDGEFLKEILLLELEGGFLLQGIGLSAPAGDSDQLGSVTKRTYELTDEQIANLMDARSTRRGTGASNVPNPDLTNYFELALRVVGAYIDAQRTHDVFLLEQDGSFVVRLFSISGSRIASHQLVEFTRDDILAMIGSAPGQRT